MRAIWKLRAGPVRVYVFPRSWPWLVQVGRHSWWPLDRRPEAVEGTATMADLLAGLQAALANVEAAHDPKVDGHLGLLLNAESILRSLIVEAEATPPAREAEKPCETCEGRGQIRRFFDSRPAIVPCPSCGGSGRTETKP